MKDRIYLKDWLFLKPYHSISKTDRFYLKLANDVKDAMVSQKEFFLVQQYIDKEEVNILACFLTSYFEDLVSGTHLWNTFVREHKKRYHKALPFFELGEDYYEEEINIQDVNFLLWYYLASRQNDRFISPYNGFLTILAGKVMEVLDGSWETAPENEYLQSFYKIDDDDHYDYYKVRSLMDITIFQSYLFYPDTILRIMSTELELIEKEEDFEFLKSLISENRDHHLHKFRTRLLGFSSKEWVAQISTNKKQVKEDILNISPRVKGFFLYKGQDENSVFLEHIASGKLFNLSKKSFDYSYELNEIDTIVYFGLIEWKGEWWFSGIYVRRPFDANLILDEKNSVESRQSVAFLDHRIKDSIEVLNTQLTIFKNFNSNSQIAFVSSNQIQEYLNSYTAYYNESLKLSLEEIGESKKRATAEGFFGGDENITELPDEDLAVIFFNPKSGLEIAFNVASAFPLPNNPFYIEEENENDIKFLLFSEEISKELVEYCILHCKDEIPFFNNGMGKLYLNDLDFLLRFLKKEYYFTTPAISYIGQDDFKEM